MTDNVASDQVHAHALDLRDQLASLHAVASNPELEPGGAPPDLNSQISVAEDRLFEYLHDNRDVLSHTDFWRGEYDAMNHEQPTTGCPDAPELEL